MRAIIVSMNFSIATIVNAILRIAENPQPQILNPKLLDPKPCL